MSKPWKEKHESVEALRKMLDLSAKMLYMPSGIEQEKLQISHIPALWLRPELAAAEKVILYLHGGGYSVGSIKTHRAAASRLAQVSESHSLIIDYRLAPEFPFPAALEDAVLAYRYLLEQGYMSHQIILAGDSAGGGLCLALQLSLREMKLPLPAASVCFSPWADLTQLSETAHRLGKNDPIVPLEELPDWALLYAGETSTAHPMISPLLGDLSALPPVLIQASDAEVLTHQAIRLAEALTKAEVEVELDLWPDMLHVWQVMWQFVPEGESALKKAALFMQNQWMRAGIAAIQNGSAEELAA